MLVVEDVTKLKYYGFEYDKRSDVHVFKLDRSRNVTLNYLYVRRNILNISIADVYYEDFNLDIIYDLVKDNVVKKELLE